MRILFFLLFMYCNYYCSTAQTISSYDDYCTKILEIVNCDSDYKVYTELKTFKEPDKVLKFVSYLKLNRLGHINNNGLLTTLPDTKEDLKIFFYLKKISSDSLNVLLDNFLPYVYSAIIDSQSFQVSFLASFMKYNKLLNSLQNGELIGKKNHDIEIVESYGFEEASCEIFMKYPNEYIGLMYSNNYLKQTMLEQLKFYHVLLENEDYFFELLEKHKNSFSEHDYAEILKGNSTP